MRFITAAMREDREFKEAMLALREQLSATRPLPLSASGLSEGAREAFVVETLRELSAIRTAPTLLLVREETEGRALAALLSEAGLPAVYYPARDFVFLNITASHDTERERLSVLCRVLAGECPVVIATPYAALQRTLPPDVLKERSLSLRVGAEIAPEVLAERLLSLGFVPTPFVESVGQFARRGGIFDLFVAGQDAPVRLEFFGDEIDRMEFFDPISQRVTQPADSLSLFPARESLWDAEKREELTAAHTALLKRAEGEVALTLRQEQALLDAAGDIPFADRYLALLYPTFASLLSYFWGARNAVLVLGDSGMKESCEEQLRALAEEGTSLVERGLLASRYNSFCAPYGELVCFLSEQIPLYISGFGSSYQGKLGGLFGFRTRRTVSYFGKEALLCEDIDALKRGFYRIAVVCETAAEADACREMLTERGITAHIATAESDAGLLRSDSVAVVAARYPAGYELLVPKVAFLSLSPDEGARQRRARAARVRRARPAGQKILSYADLSVGDYVVHAVHGIGVFEGMQQIRRDGMTHDYITIRYAGTDSLLLPAERLEMIAKYIGAGSDEGTVRLSRLGGGDWQRQKSRARAAAKNMARELIALYAERQKREGYAYPPESALEREFADAFEFEETEPQLQAIEEIVGDMMRPVPMDRLLCGDVGFGKTEVALRAAFKAIVAGKQVAILVPTTILAMQHYQTAISRMRGYAVNIDTLSRLKKPKEQERTLRRLARGEIDLIIGTHSLLSKNVSFRDLGLLIVDEEQRFGVGQKEKLKALAKDVDVLTLSATPIPRTLNMAMSGIRDMSVLDEAPADRHPVQTYVMEHSDILIEEAVRRELARGGQVLYLYNRVESMERPAAHLARTFPEARIAFAHGKMSKEELEDIWQALVRGEIDILICTTIVETGIDLPSANTLIIEDADRMGLSQLHQLRGRVGRSGRQAYAYFTYRRGKSLSEIAEKRLAAIREYAAFGAGFKIALRDLEIRGAGNLLGAEQHGHIDAVGYDLYVRLLNEAILEERGELPEQPFEARIELAVDAHIPEGYIRTSPERMEMYKKISLIRNKEDVADVTDELCDRYGEPPRAVLRLLYVAALRAMSSASRIAKVDEREGLVRFFAETPDLAGWSLLFDAHKNLRFISTVTGPMLVYRVPRGEESIESAYRLMCEYTAARNEAKND